MSGAFSSGLCDLDRVSRGDLVERVGDISLSRGGNAIMSGVDESMCRTNSVLAAGILDSCGVEVVDDGVACDDGTRLPDAFRVGGCLSVVGSGVAPPGWVDGLFCADGSLRPEPHRCPQCVLIIGLSDLCVCVTLSITVGSLVCLVWG